MLYTDVDEILVAPNATRYPRGLRDLLVEFVNDPRAVHWRGLGFNVGHVSQVAGKGGGGISQVAGKGGEGQSEKGPLEPPMDW